MKADRSAVFERFDCAPVLRRAHERLEVQFERAIGQDRELIERLERRLWLWHGIVGVVLSVATNHMKFAN